MFDRLKLWNAKISTKTYHLIECILHTHLDEMKWSDWVRESERRIVVVQWPKVEYRSSIF